MPVDQRAGIVDLAVEWFWLSFVDEDRPKGDRFLGALLIEAEDPRDAIMRSWATRQNPGGQVAIWGEFEPEKVAKVDPKWKNRLLSREEIRESGLNDEA